LCLTVTKLQFSDKILKLNSRNIYEELTEMTAVAATADANAFKCSIHYAFAVGQFSSIILFSVYYTTYFAEKDDRKCQHSAIN